MSVTTDERTATSDGPDPTTSFRTATRLVAEREVRAAIRTKGTWVTFALMVVGLFAATVLPNVFAGDASKVAVVGQPAAQVAERAGFEVSKVTDRAAAERQVRDKSVDAAILLDSPDARPAVIALDKPPDDVLEVTSNQPTIDQLDPAPVSFGIRYLVTFLFGLVFFLMTIGYGMTIAQSVVTEKQTRIVEILVSTIPVRALLTGKIVGNSALAIAQVAVLALLTPVALRLGEQGALLGMIGGALGWFVPFFVLGFVLLAALYAVAGSLVSRMEDLASSSSVVQMLAMLPYFGVIVFINNPVGMAVLSYIPFSAPVAMPARLFTGDAQVWEPFVAMLLLLASVAVAIVVGARLYSGSLMRTRGKVALRQAWSRAE